MFCLDFFGSFRPLCDDSYAFGLGSGNPPYAVDYMSTLAFWVIPFLTVFGGYTQAFTMLGIYYAIIY